MIYKQNNQNENKNTKSVCFSGYRPEKMPKAGDETTDEIKAIKNALRIAIQNAIDGGYTHFITGMACGFDIWAGEEVVRIREKNKRWCKSRITLEGAIPFREQSRNFTDNYKDRYDKLLMQMDKMSIVNMQYSRGCYYSRNRHMVDASSMLITYFDGKKGGTAYTNEYAIKRGLHIVNIFGAENAVRQK